MIISYGVSTAVRWKINFKKIVLNWCRPLGTKLTSTASHFNWIWKIGNGFTMVRLVNSILCLMANDISAHKSIELRLNSISWKVNVQIQRKVFIKYQSAMDSRFNHLNWMDWNGQSKNLQCLHSTKMEGVYKISIVQIWLHVGSRHL